MDLYSTPEGSQIAATPPGSIVCGIAVVSGGVAVLHHRLMSATPPGSKTPES